MRELLTCLFETSRGRGVAVDEVIATAGLPEMLGLELSPRDGIARMLARVRELRYPELTRRRQAFATLASALGRSRSWRVEQDCGFERSTVLLQTLVRNRAELDRAVEELDRLRSAGDWERLWAAAGGVLPEES